MSEADYPRTADERVLAVIRSVTRGNSSTSAIAKRFGITVGVVERMVSKIREADLRESGEDGVAAAYRPQKSPASNRAGGAIGRR